MSGRTAKLIKKFGETQAWPPAIYRSAKRVYSSLPAAGKRQMRWDMQQSLLNPPEAPEAEILPI
ncbi:MAG: hypothetical protein ACO3PR_00025 [Limisphaerales bacterium]